MNFRLWALGTAAFLLLVGCRSPSDERERHVRTLLTTTLEPRPASDTGSPFLRALAELATAQRLDPNDYVRYRPDSRGYQRSSRMISFNQGRAVELPADGRTYVVVILENQPPIHPGWVVEHLVLLDADGQILDKFRCAHADPMVTKVLNPPDRDGAQLAIVVVAPSPLHRLRIEAGRLKLLTPPSGDAKSENAQEVLR